MAKQPHQTVTKAKDWKKDAGPTDHVPLEVPSGHTCLVRPIGPEAFLKEGLIPNPLIATIMEAVDFAEAGKSEADVAKRAKKQQKKLASAMVDMTKDPERLKSIFQMADSVTVFCVVEPQVLPIPTPDPISGEVPERDPAALYVDEVDFEDKMFITAFAMSGVRDLESFRRELEGSVGVGYDRAAMAGAPEPADGAN